MYIFLVLGDDPIKLSIFSELEVVLFLENHENADDINYFFANLEPADV